MVNPKSLENLRPWQPGESGNPDGKPPGTTFKSVLNHLLDLRAKGSVLDTKEVKEFLEEVGKDKTISNRAALAIRMLAKALSNPDSKSAERLLDRAEGKPVQGLEFSGELKTANTLKIEIVDSQSESKPDISERTIESE